MSLGAVLALTGLTEQELETEILHERFPKPFTIFGEHVRFHTKYVWLAIHGTPRYFPAEFTSENVQKYRRSVTEAQSISRSQYPPVPYPCETNDPPACSGVYFVWSGESVVYVGISKQLQVRTKTCQHANILGTDRISWLPFSEDDLHYAECYYIGVLRPCRNGGNGREAKPHMVKRRTRNKELVESPTP